MAIKAKRPMVQFRLRSIEDASVIRKFAVLFSLMSFFPFVVLAAIFFYIKIKGGLTFSPVLLFWTVSLVGVFALIGFFGMRKSLTNLIKVSETAKDVIEGKLSKRIDIKTDGDNEVARIARAFNDVIQQLETNISELEKSKTALQSVLGKVASGVSSTENIDTFLDLILETTVGALGAKTGMILLSDEDKNELIVKSIFGVSAASYSRDQRIPLDSEVVGWVVKQNKPLLIPRLHKVGTPKPGGKVSAFEPPLICSPLVFQNKVVGAISIRGKVKVDNFEEEELVTLSNLSAQIALAIANAKLNADAQQTYLETITALALAVEARDPYSRGHSDRVSKYSVMIAQKLGLSEEIIRIIKEAAQLHDVGKIGISDQILSKPGELNNYEREIMRQHPVIGEGIIIPLHGFSHLRSPIRHHHEWLDGEGYPDHLKGDRVLLEARILAVADAFDAMTTDRPYRKGLSLEQAKQELIKYKGIRYDSKIVDALISCL